MKSEHRYGVSTSWGVVHGLLAVMLALAVGCDGTPPAEPAAGSTTGSGAGWSSTDSGPAEPSPGDSGGAPSSSGGPAGVDQSTGADGAGSTSGGSTTASGGEVVPGTFVEQDGFVVAEAEGFFSHQMGSMVQSWELCTTEQTPDVEPDPDGSHAADASEAAYLEALPDIKVEHGGVDSEHGLQEQGGLGATLSYRVYFDAAGTYRFWVRMYVDDVESNSIHVGIDGDWPELGSRVEGCRRDPACDDITSQSCKYYKQGADQPGWNWVKTRRYPHHGCYGPEELMAQLEVPSPGLHLVTISMREDGTEIDKWILTRDLDFVPEDEGPAQTPLVD